MTNFVTVILLKEVKIQEKNNVQHLHFKCSIDCRAYLFFQCLDISKHGTLSALLQAIYQVGSSKGPHAAPRHSIHTVKAILWMRLILSPTKEEVFPTIIRLWPVSSVFPESRAKRFWIWTFTRRLVGGMQYLKTNLAMRSKNWILCNGLCPHGQSCSI